MVANPTGVNGPRQERTTGRLRNKLTNLASKQNVFPTTLVSRPYIAPGGKQGTGRKPQPTPKVTKAAAAKPPDVKATLEKLKALTQTQVPTARTQPVFPTPATSVASTLAGLSQGIGRAPQAGPSGPVGSGGSPRENMAMGKALSAQMGWTGAEWKALKQLWMRESGWRTDADNPTSSAYGIPQAMMSVHFGGVNSERAQRYMQNPRLQIMWGLRYIQNRYGSPQQALRHSDANGWY